MTEQLERKAREVIVQLTAHGFTAYFVGGYVRDKLAGRPVKDIDIATSALPDDVMRLFPRTAPTGLQHGTVTVINEPYAFEVTTFRTESEYERHRRPASVRFVPDLEQDLQRRDFTINAIAMDADGRVIDPYGGQADLQAGVLRCVGDPALRFREDALRMMRCLRFACGYELRIEPATWSALCEQAPLLQHIAMERIYAEMARMMEGSRPDRAVDLLVRSGLARWFKEGADLPWSRWPEAPQPLMEGLRAVGGDHSARWAFLFVFMGLPPDETSRVLRRLKFPRQKLEEIARVMEIGYWLRSRPAAIADTSSPESAEETEGELRKLWQRAVLKFGRPAAASWCRLPDSAGPFQSVLRKSGKHWMEQLRVHRITDLQITGHDLLRHFRTEAGPWVGEMLERLLEDVAVNGIDNTKTALLRQAETYKEC